MEWGGVMGWSGEEEWGGVGRSNGVEWGGGFYLPACWDSK